MLVRCERCRAVFRQPAIAQASVLECSHCHHVFPPPTNELIALQPQGFLGGAAAIASAAVPVAPPVPPVQTVTRQPKSQGSPVTITLLSLVVGALALIALRSPEKPAAPNAEARSLVRSSRMLIRKDDNASLERALTQLSAASTLEPKDVDIRADKAFTLLLLGATLRAETDDLLAELSGPVPTAEGLAALPEAEQSAAIQRAASARERLPALNSRADELVREGIALAHEIAAPGQMRTAAQQRALWLADAFDHRQERLQAPPAGRADDKEFIELVSWWHFARATAADSVATAEKELRAALGASPSNLRARWMLGRLLAAKTPPDPSATELLGEVLASNTQHGGAARDRARLNVANAPTTAAAHP